MSRANDYKNIGILALCEAIFMTTSLVNFAIAALAVGPLMEDSDFATLPLAMIPIVSMLVTIPASYAMKYIGRRAGFILGAFFGVASGALCAYALYISSFALFVVGVGLMGVYQAFATYYRFAVADQTDDKIRGQAVALVLAGGLLAAFIGPTVASASRELFTPVMFVGSYTVTIALNLGAVMFLAFLTLPKGQVTQRPKIGRFSLRPIFADGQTVTAMMFCGIGNAAMMLVMTATPLAMIGCGFDVSDSSNVLSWHIAAMFAPFLISGSLISKFGTERIMLSGLFLMGISSLVAFSGTTQLHFAGALILSGFAWNFMYVGGSTLLASNRDEENRALIQGVNEFFCFAMTALGALSSGLIYARLGWWQVCAIAAAFCFALLLLLVWSSKNRSRMIDDRNELGEAP